MADYVTGTRSRVFERRDSNVRGSAAEPQVPFMPWSAAVYDYNVANEAKYDPEGYCLPPGGPRLFTAPYPMEIMQLPSNQKRVFILLEISHTGREIYMDGRQHPAAGDGTWLGDPSAVTRMASGRSRSTLRRSTKGKSLNFHGHCQYRTAYVIKRS